MNPDIHVVAIIFVCALWLLALDVILPREIGKRREWPWSDS